MMSPTYMCARIFSSFTIDLIFCDYCCTAHVVALLLLPTLQQLGHNTIHNIIFIIMAVYATAPF